MSAFETGQMSAAETGQMSSAETRQMSTVARTDICFVSTQCSCLRNLNCGNVTMFKSQISGLALNRRKWPEMGPEWSPGPENQSPGMPRPFSRLWDRSRGQKPSKIYLKLPISRHRRPLLVVVICSQDKQALAQQWLGHDQARLLRAQTHPFSSLQ